MKKQQFKATNQRIECVELKNLAVGNYQRPTSTIQVCNIVNNFDEAKLGLLVVNLRDRKYQLLDGAHRAAALRQLGYTHAMCIVLEGLTYEEEADYFRKQNDNSRRLTAYNLFRAALEAGDKMACHIRDIAGQNGYVVSMAGRSRNRKCIQAINALYVIYKTYGSDTLNRTLALLRDTWDYDEMAVKREFLAGTADFINRFGEAKFAERLKNCSLNSIWRKYMDLSEFTSRITSSQNTRTAFCEALVFHYNRGLPAKKKLFVERKRDYDDA